MIDTSFLVGQTPTPLLNPYEVQQRQNALALQGQAIQSGTLQNQQTQQAMADEQATRAAIQAYYAQPQPGTQPNALAPSSTPAPSPAGAPSNDQAFQSFLNPQTAAPQSSASPAAAPPPPPAVAVPRPPIPTMADLIQRGVPPSHASALISQFQKIDETSATISKTRADAAKAQKEGDDLVLQQGSDMANMLVKTTPAGQPINPQFLQWHLQHFASLGPQQAAQAQAVGTQLSQLSPDGQVAFLKTLAGTPKTMEANAAATTAQSKEDEVTNLTRKTDAELPGIAADSQTKQLAAAGKAPIQPAEAARLKLEAAAQAESRRHNRVEENAAAQNREAVSLTPDARDQMATYFATTGQLPNLGMGAAVAKTRSDIINRAAEMYPHVAFASNAANFQANKASLKNVQGTLDTLSAFENAGLKNLKMFTDAAAKIPDSGVPWLNTPVRMLDEKLVGSTNMSVVNAAREIGLREIARVTNDPKLSGVLSDSARHEVQGFSPANATLPQILNVAKTLQQDMANVHSSLAEQRDAINNRIGTDPTAKPDASAAASKPAFKVGDSVMYNGASHKVTAIKPDGKLVLGS